MSNNLPENDGELIEDVYDNEDSSDQFDISAIAEAYTIQKTYPSINPYTGQPDTSGVTPYTGQPDTSGITPVNNDTVADQNRVVDTADRTPQQYTIDNSQNAGTPGDPIVNPTITEQAPLPTTRIVRTTSYYDMMISDFSPAALTSLQSNGYKAIAVYDDGTEAEVPWSEVHDLSPAAEYILTDIEEMTLANNQHFWTRTENPDGAGSGAFVTDDEQDAFIYSAQANFADQGDVSETVEQIETFTSDGWTTEYNLYYAASSTDYEVTINGYEISNGITKNTTGFVFDEAPDIDATIKVTYDVPAKPWHNLLLNSYGLALRQGLTTLAAFTKSAVTFFDGDGNQADNINAYFGRDGSRIGKDAESHIQLDYHSLQLIDIESNRYLYVSDLRDHDGRGPLLAEECNGSYDSTHLNGIKYSLTYPVYRINNQEQIVSITCNGTSVEYEHYYPPGTYVPGYGTITDPMLVLSYSGIVKDSGNPYTIRVTYYAEGDKLKAFTFGNRVADAFIAPLSVSFGIDNIVSGGFSFAEGRNATASGKYSHAEGHNAIASGDRSHAEGGSTTASGTSSHAEGYYTTASDFCSHAEGNHASASGFGSHAEGERTTASGFCSHAEGYYAAASGDRSHAEGDTTSASGDYSHAEGHYTTASGHRSHAEGESTTASGYGSHAEGDDTTASEFCSHAEGESTTASGSYSHAEGYYTAASKYGSHAEGYYANASGDRSHAEGSYTTASGFASHAEGDHTTASSDYSHASGEGTITSAPHQFVIGKYNASNYDAAFIIGNGSSTSSRSNAAWINTNGRFYTRNGIGRIGVTNIDSAPSGDQWYNGIEWVDDNNRRAANLELGHRPTGKMLSLVLSGTPGTSYQSGLVITKSYGNTYNNMLLFNGDDGSLKIPGTTIINGGMHWPAPTNVACFASANGQEWSFDMGSGQGSTYTGCYWQIWSGRNSKTVLSCYNDDMRVEVPNGPLNCANRVTAYNGNTWTNGFVIRDTRMPLVHSFSAQTDSAGFFISPDLTANNFTGRVFMRELYDNRRGLMLETSRTINNSRKFNHIIIMIDSSGNSTYAVSNAANFRSAIGAAASSDRRLKTNLTPLGEEAVKFINSLTAYQYDIGEDMWRRHEVGVIAQDVNAADPWHTKMAFQTEDGLDGLDDWEKMRDGSSTWKLDYIRLIPPLITTVQSQAKRIERLEKIIAQLVN